MVKVKLRNKKHNEDKEARIKKAIHAVKVGDFPSLRRTAEAYDIPLTTLRRRLGGGVSCALAHESQQLLTVAEEKAVVRWIYRLEEFGFPPRTQHVKEAVSLLKESTWTEGVGKNWITRFLNRHPDLVSKFSSQFDKKRLKMSNPEVVNSHFSKVRKLQHQYNLKDSNTYNVDEKGFRLGISDRAKVICKRREREMTGKLATDGNRELITVIECVSGSGQAIAPFVIYKGASHYMGWYQHLDPQATEGWKFAYSSKGWTNRMLGLEWIKHFDLCTSKEAKGAYRLLILDGHGSHVNIAFIEYCLSTQIVVYCLPSHSTHLLQPLDVGLFSPLQKYYGQEVDKLTRFGDITIRKGNFLPMLVAARQATFTKANIMGAWRGSGLIPLNARVVLAKLPHGQSQSQPHDLTKLGQTSAKPSTAPPTPQNISHLNRMTRKAKLLLLKDEIPRDEVIDLINAIQHFGIAKDTDLQLERDNIQKQQRVQNMQAKPDRRELGTGLGTVLDSKVLGQLYQERERAITKSQRSAKPIPELKGSKGGISSLKGKQKAIISSSSEGEYVSAESGHELDSWDDEVESNISLESFITLATPYRTPLPPHVQTIIPATSPSPSSGPAPKPPSLSGSLGRYVLRSRHNRK